MTDKLENLKNSFHLMWDHFPEPCTLVHKSKEVIAVNPACDIIGRRVGMICSQHGPAAAHQGCLANKALSEQRAQFRRVSRDDMNLLVFWMPVNGYPDYYIHFGLSADRSEAV